MSDLTLESVQVYSHAIGSTCDAVDGTIKASSTMLAKAEELTGAMREVKRLAQQVKDMRRVVDMLEAQFASELAQPTPSAPGRSPTVKRKQ